MKWLLLIFLVSLSDPGIAQIKGELLTVEGDWYEPVKEIHESWHLENNSYLKGHSYKVDEKNRKSTLERSEIVVIDDKIVYHAEPTGAVAVSFELIDLKDGVFLFTNYQHDFPQEIRYQPVAKAQMLLASISGDGKLFPYYFIDPDLRTKSFIREEKIVKANPGHVFQLWTTKEGLESFFAPKANVQLKIGGPYELYFAPDATTGSRGSEDCEIVSFYQDRWLAFTWNAPPHLPEARKERSLVGIEFIPVGDDQTKLILTHLGFKSGTQWDQTVSYFEKAWPEVLNSLAQYLEK